MSLSSAMLVGYTGIKSNAVSVDTVGDNLANLNTTAFKGQRTLFETLLYRTVREGQGPGATTGGTLPEQIGSGSTVASVQRNFAQGGLESTGFQSDLALDGDGFFILDGAGGQQTFTRDGSFRLDASQTLVSANGRPLQVFSADGSGAIQPGSLSDLVVPLGSASEAVATTAVVMEGRLDSGTNIASDGAVVVSQPLVTASGAPATSTTSLTDLVDAGGLELFSDGDTLQIGGSVGTVSAPQRSFIIGTDGTTLGDLAGHLEATLGINVDPAAGGTPGVTISDGTEFPAGSLVIQSNRGLANAVALDAGSITNTTGVIPSPFSFSTAREAVGDGVTTSFNVFDSLGNPVPVRLRFAVESRSESGTTWRYFAESTGDSDLSPSLGTGTVTFDTNGQFVSATGDALSIDRAGVGSTSPLTFGLNFERLTGLASGDGTSEVTMTDQDGKPAGIMTGYSIDRDGIVTGAFSNNHTRVLGQVALAVFANNQGLLGQSDNTFLPGDNSGAATIVAPRTQGAGSVVEGTLEQGNVEIAREFINLISAQTGISSASRVVRVADEMLQELLLLAR